MDYECEYADTPRLLPMISPTPGANTSIAATVQLSSFNRIRL